MSTTLTINPELRALIPPLTTEELTQLEYNITEWGCRDALIIWEERQELLDGHNRYAICQRYDLPFATVGISLPDLNAAKDWMLKHQLGRRNLTARQQKYLRGKLYEQTKQTRGGDRNSKGKSYPLKSTAQSLATQESVSEKTIKNDAAFAKAIDAVANAVGPDARQELLASNSDLGDQEVKLLAGIAEASPQTAKQVVEDIKKAPTPKAKRRVVREAAQEVPKPTPQKKTLASVLTLDIQDAEPQRGIEELPGEDGKHLFVLHNPDSKPVFNEQKNDMIDWAKWSWNPVTGCWHGCEWCYAREIANKDYMSEVYPKKFEPTFHPSRLAAPGNTPFPKHLNASVERNVFTCSMADLFGKWVPEEWIMRVFEQVKIHQQWNFLFLTKFPQRLQEVCDTLGGFPANAWVGCTVDTQARVKTAERAFRHIKASVRWLSVEPMLERLTFSSLAMFDWLVMGGLKATPFNHTEAFQPEWEWVEHLWQQARDANVKVYWKENLTIRPKELPTTPEEP